MAFFCACAVAAGEEGEAGAVEIYAGEVDEVGVLLGEDAHDAEEEFAALDALDAADIPRAGGDAILQGAGGGVEAVEVVPAVALAGPKEIVAEPLVPVLLRVVDEGGAGVFDEGGGCAGGGHFDDAENLVAALIIEEGEVRAVGGPAQIADVPGLCK